MSRLTSIIKDLENQINRHNRCAQELEAENTQLQQAEEALLLTVATLQGSLSVLSADRRLHTADADLQRPGSRPTDLGTGSDDASSSHSSSSTLLSSPNLQPGDECSRGGSNMTYLSPSIEQHTASCLLDARPPLLLMQQLLPGAKHEVCQSSVTTPTSLTLARLSGSPERVASYLALTQEQRLQWLAAAAKRLALLLPKYDNLPQYREEADSIADEIVARGLTYTWLDTESFILVQANLVNIETGQQEPTYPAGLWHHVAKSIALTQQQKRSLHALWSRTKSTKALLLREHEALLQQLEVMQQQQHARQQLFAEEAQQLPVCRPWQWPAWHSQQQQPPTTLSQQQQQQQQQQVQVQPQPQRTPLLLEPPLHQDPAAELLLAVPCAAQRQIEARLSVLRDQLALNVKLIVTLLWNLLSKKQHAALVVGSWPYCPDIHALCDAFDELGW